MRVAGTEGEFLYSVYDNKALLGIQEDDIFGLGASSRKPVFDVKVKAHKKNAYSRAASNADAVNFFSMGFFDPSRAKEALACMELLDIENKEKIKGILKRNAKSIGELSL